MERVQYHEIAKLEKTDWWYESRRRLINLLIKKYCQPCFTALDIGCGTGANMRVLQNLCNQVSGIDYSNDAIRYCKKNKLFNVKKGSITKIPYKSESFDLILCSDVLEHVNDKQAIKEMYRVLKKEGHLILMVPAFNSLWNDNDDLSEHLRRYRAPELQKLLRSFHLKKLTYWNALMFAPAWLLSKKQKMFPSEHKQNNLNLVPKFANNILKLWFGIENPLAAHAKLPFGTSVIAVAQKL